MLYMQTNETDFETHVDDIVKAVGDKLERNVIVSELKRYVDEYGIDLATAKESIVSHGPEFHDRSQ